MGKLELTWLEADTPFPPLSRALRQPAGLLAAGGDLSPRRLVSAYRQGIFPWFGEGDPILWWSLDPRMVLIPEEFKLHRSLKKTLRNSTLTITRDKAFADVIAACAGTSRAGQDGTWIQPEMVLAYRELHRMGIAHSVETWRGDKLVGGLYGLKLGQVFFGESMFAHETDASKLALAHLVEHVKSLGVAMIDCQQQTGHLASLGARPIPLSEFRARLDQWIPDPLDLSF